MPWIIKRTQTAKPNIHKNMAQLKTFQNDFIARAELREIALL